MGIMKSASASSAEASFVTVVEPPLSGSASSDIQTAITAAATAGGGIVQLQAETYEIVDAIVWPTDACNVVLRGVPGTILDIQCIDNVWALDLQGTNSIRAINNIAAQATGITFTTAAQAGDVAAGDVIRVMGTDSDGMLRCMRVVASAAGNTGTGLASLEYVFPYALTSVTASVVAAKNNGIECLEVLHSAGASHFAVCQYQDGFFMNDIRANGQDYSASDFLTLHHSTNVKSNNVYCENYNIIENYLGSDICNPLSLLNVYDVKLSNWTIINGANSTLATSKSVKMADAIDSLHLENFKVIDSQSFGVYAGTDVSLVNSKFDNLLVQNSRLEQFYMANTADLKNVKFDGCDILQGRTVGMQFVTVGIAKDLSINNCSFYGNAQEGLSLQSIDGLSLTGSILSGNANGAVIYQCTNFAITGNTIQNNTSQGLYPWDSDDGTITGNTINNNAHGIYSEGSCNNLVISGNSCKDNATNNLRLTATDLNFTIGSNDFGGTLVTYSTGTGHKIDNNNDGIYGITAFTPNITWENQTATGFRSINNGIMRMDIRWIATAAPTTAALTLTMPTGWAIDTAKMTAGAELQWINVPNAYMANIGVANYIHIRANAASSTTINFHYSTALPGLTAQVTKTAPFTFDTNDIFWAILEFPVVTA
jgi:parallel beta-helix repeat protein